MSNLQTQESHPIQDFSQLLKAAGDILRLDILCALAKGSFGVLELCTVFDIKQSGMSHHLKVLANANLVVTRKEGNSIFYQRATVKPEDPAAEIKSAIFQSIDKVELADNVKANLQKIYQQRSQASNAFFSENSERFTQQQDLIAAYDVYGVHVAQMLDSSSLKDFDVALEIGPGAGEFLEVLSDKFKYVSAVDNSSEMLAKATHYCQQKGLSNIHFILDDSGYCRRVEHSLNCIVLNMVLHHIPSPEQTLEDIALGLRKGGIVIICDLCRHDQDWTHNACGDLWLGFEPEDLNAWAKSNQLHQGQSSYFALRNGFQIQIREFIKN
ncbi:ArsR/SmtB family transcription factor [Agarilytica rhodophyticola]|uniref:ArsR/SmtB family transcription factor n=1 Tax=Agarilytica rhodophyticola TaxID=1737490 RepID=UPI000B343723|nr:metalloregulator ArsR/SmtB family transcription factor [Agarilytica rhodophyticola]